MARRAFICKLRKLGKHIVCARGLMLWCAGLLLLGSVSFLGCTTPPPAPIPVEKHEEFNPLHTAEFTFEQMDAIVDFSDEERPAVEEAFEQAAKAYEAQRLKVDGDGTNPQRETLAQTQAKMEEAARKGDVTLMRSYEVKLRPGRQAMREVLLDSEKDILAALSSESLARWEGYLIVKKLQELTKPLGLSDEQVQQLRFWANESVANMSPELDRISAGFFHMESRMEEEMLTSDQRASYQQIKADNPRRGLSW